MKRIVLIALLGISGIYAADPAQGRSVEEIKAEQEVALGEQVRAGAALSGQILNEGFGVARESMRKKDMILIIAAHSKEFLMYQQDYFAHRSNADALAEKFIDIQIDIGVDVAMATSGAPEMARPIFREEIAKQKPMMLGMILDGWKTATIAFRVAAYKDENSDATEQEIDAFVELQMQLLQNDANDASDDSSSDSE